MGRSSPLRTQYFNHFPSVRLAQAAYNVAGFRALAPIFPSFLQHGVMEEEAIVKDVWSCTLSTLEGVR
jgi:hypothetical protein